MTATGPDEERPRTLGALVQVVDDRVQGDASTQEALDSYVDVFQAHLGIRLSQNDHDRLADGAELASAVRPPRAGFRLLNRGLVRDVTCETLEEVREGMV